MRKLIAAIKDGMDDLDVPDGGAASGCLGTSATARPSTIEKVDPPKPPRARMHCVDYLGLLGRYDDIDMLGFAISDMLPSDQVAGQFPYAKTAGIDRLISNRRPRNSQECSLGASNERFPQGCMLWEKQLLPSKNWRGSGDDLENMQHEFRVTEERALKNQFWPTGSVSQGETYTSSEASGGFGRLHR